MFNFLRFLGVCPVEKVTGVFREHGPWTSSARAPLTRLYRFVVIDSPDGDVVINNFRAPADIENDLGNEVTVWVQPSRNVFDMFVRTNMIVAWRGMRPMQASLIGTTLLTLVMLTLCALMSGLLTALNWVFIALLAYPAYVGPNGVYWISATFFMPLIAIWLVIVPSTFALWRGYLLVRRENANGAGSNEHLSSTGRKVVHI